VPAVTSLSDMADLSDIATRDDCERLVRAFYAKAMTDPMIGFLFTDIAQLDLESHVPQITAFWETVLLGAKSYGGGAFAPHARLNAQVPLRAGHFERWLWLWRGTVDELFAGETADLAKAHADRVGHAFYQRIAALQAGADPEGPPMPAPLSIAVTHHGGAA
jgi:hemoglobin